MDELPENVSAPWSARREAEGIWDVVLSDGTDLFTVYGSKAEPVAKAVADAINNIDALTAERDALRAQVEVMRMALIEIAGPRDRPHSLEAMVEVREIARDAIR